MYNQAKYPDRIFCGVVQQLKFREEDCLDSCPDCAARRKSGHIRVIEYDFSDARGPCSGAVPGVNIMEWRRMVYAD